jgi:hypothetical protein
MARLLAAAPFPAGLIADEGSAVARIVKEE